MTRLACIRACVRKSGTREIDDGRFRTSSRKRFALFLLTLSMYTRKPAPVAANGPGSRGSQQKRAHRPRRYARETSLLGMTLMTNEIRLATTSGGCLVVDATVVPTINPRGVLARGNPRDNDSRLVTPLPVKVSLLRQRELA